MIILLLLIIACCLLFGASATKNGIGTIAMYGFLVIAFLYLLTMLSSCMK